MTVSAVRTDPYALFDVRVLARRSVTPRLHRITLVGDGLRGMAATGWDQRVKLVLPAPDGTLDGIDGGEGWYARWRELPESARPVLRTYTVRALRPWAGELDIDLVDHGEVGPASRFGRSACPGQRVLVHGPSAAHPGPHGGREFRVEAAGRSELLLVGDDTAVPAISAVLEHLPPSARGLALLETEHADGIHPLAGPAGVEVRWLVRQGERGRLQQEALRSWWARRPRPAAAADAGSVVLADGEDSSYWEVPAAGGHEADVFAWVAGESGAVRRLRRTLVDELGVPRGAVAFMGYWREGRSEC